ncbi:RBBP9/YdeN family alpha/beta hydrolase [Sphingomonas flavalba]|uniref:RBBP9/YdeN family alpha/beta hydrolase n=1 Tax=Sphingomonas flavalba TaxID=2559804 RepID=UPI0039E0D2D5
MGGSFPAAPRLLTVPGIDNSGRDHWQSRWERERDDCYRIDLGCWSDPIRNVWISRVDQAVHDAQGDVVLIAHSLGCHAVAWWAQLLGPSGAARVRGALLVAPPDVDLPGTDVRVARFGPTSQAPLPFPALLVASRDDSYATIDRSREMAARWGALLVDAGELGHINARSRLGSWPQGQELAALLTGKPLRRAELGRRAARIVARNHHRPQPPTDARAAPAGASRHPPDERPGTS